MSPVPNRAPSASRFRTPLIAALSVSLIGSAALFGSPTAAAAPVVTENGWSYDAESYDTGVANGYQLALDTTNRKVYLSDAAWSKQTRTVTDNGDGTYTYGADEFTVGSGKLSVFDVATRSREAAKSFLNLTRNDGNGKESEPFSWANAAATAAMVLGDAAPEWLAARGLDAWCTGPDAHARVGRWRDWCEPAPAGA